MKIILNIFIALFIFIQFSSDLYSQSGYTFPEFKEKLFPYFDEALIKDVQLELPTGDNYRIWGWSVGEYSGDGYYDLAFAIRHFGLREKTVDVYLFVDIEGYLTKVEKLSRNYVEIPLEVGLVIRENTCYITEKFEKFHWAIKGYTFDNGSLSLVDEFITKKIDRFTHESYRNFVELKSNERYLLTSNGKIEFDADYITIPSYPRGKQIFKGFFNEAYSFDIDFVHKGAYEWKGENDASFYVRSAYDAKYLYLMISVVDDNVIVPSCEDCNSDKIDIWMDLNDISKFKNRFVKDIGNTIDYRNQIDENTFKFSVFLGDFAEESSNINISTSDDLNGLQKIGSKNIKSISKRTDNGYVAKIRIPFSLLNFNACPVKDEIVEWGCTVIVHDVDNEFRPEEKTEIATSKFSSADPTSYGSIILIPENEWYGQSENIYTDKIISYILEYGL